MKHNLIITILGALFGVLMVAVFSIVLAETFHLIQPREGTEVASAGDLPGRHANISANNTNDGAAEHIEPMPEANSRGLAVAEQSQSVTENGDEQGLLDETSALARGTVRGARGIAERVTNAIVPENMPLDLQLNTQAAGLGLSLTVDPAPANASPKTKGLLLP
jgi:hypothetical protein